MITDAVISQGRIQECVRGALPPPLCFLQPFPSPVSFLLPSFFLPSFPVPSFPLPFCPLFSPPILSPSLLSLPIPLEVGHCFAARWSGGALKLPQQARSEPGRQTVFGEYVSCRLKIAPVVAIVTKDTSTWSIAENAIRYLVRQSQHTSYCAMGPKSFSAVMARKTTSGAKWKTHQKQYISGASGGFFQVVEAVQNPKYF